MNPLSLLGLGISGAGDIFKTIFGISQMLKGNSMYKNLVNNIPQYQVDPNIKYNQQLSGQIASQGIPDVAKNFYGDAIDRQLGSTINAAESTGQGLGSINSAFGNSTEAFQKLLAMDAEQKLKNQDVLMSANKDLRDENLRAFQQNQLLPFSLKWQRANQLSNAGPLNTYGGGQGVGSDIFGFANALSGMNKSSGGTDYSNNTSNDWFNYMLKNFGGNLNFG